MLRSGDMSINPTQMTRLPPAAATGTHADPRLKAFEIDTSLGKNAIEMVRPPLAIIHGKGGVDVLFNTQTGVLFHDDHTPVDHIDDAVAVMLELERFATKGGAGADEAAAARSIASSVYAARGAQTLKQSVHIPDWSQFEAMDDPVGGTLVNGAAALRWAERHEELLRGGDPTDHARAVRDVAKAEKAFKEMLELARDQKFFSIDRTELLEQIRHAGGAALSARPELDRLLTQLERAAGRGPISGLPELDENNDAVLA